MQHIFLERVTLTHNSNEFMFILLVISLKNWLKNLINIKTFAVIAIFMNRNAIISNIHKYYQQLV